MNFGFRPVDCSKGIDASTEKSLTLLGIGVAVFSIFYGVSNYYFATTDYRILGEPVSLTVIAWILSIIEVAVINHLRNGKKDLAQYSESEYDSSGGCFLLIFMFICSIYFNIILINEINGRCDFSQPTKRQAKIIEKSARANSRKAKLFYNYYLKVELLDSDYRQLEFQVSDSIYRSFNERETIEFETKPGLLGYEHVCGEITKAQ